MPQAHQTDQNRTLTYFIPQELVLLVEHDAQANLAPPRIVESLLENPLVRDYPLLLEALERLRRDVAEGHRLPLTYEATDQQPAPFSLVFLRISGISDDPGDLIGLIDDLNDRIRTSQIAQGETTMQVASPNWLVAGTPRDTGVGGPGAMPVPDGPFKGDWLGTCRVDTPGTPFGFKLPPALQELTWTNDVEVAILDTAPPEDAITEAYGKWYQEHPLICDMLWADEAGKGRSRLRITYADDFLRNSGVQLPDQSASGYGIAGHEYWMYDHGLFAAGIIHTIAPQARLHLVEVLNWFGVGTVETIARGLDFAASKRRDKPAPLIVNCSLMIGIPRRGHLMRDLHWPRLAQDDAYLREIARPMEKVCDWLKLQRVLVVAAAGNDATPGNPRTLARYPAAYDSVTGVGALTRDSKPTATSYTNESEEPWIEGIATFGGETDSRMSRSIGPAAEPIPGSHPTNGMLGMYIGEFPNPNSTVLDGDGKRENPLPNYTGWARWSGTSFAAPIISGALARVLGQATPPPDPMEVLRLANPDRITIAGDVLPVQQG